jgi:DNA-binding transcriptional LysR family regulator
MNLAHLRFFVAVADTGGFTRAAEREHVTQPTLSAGIKRLEDSLGVELLDRRRRSALTEAGQRFLPRARLIVEEWRAGRREASGAGTTSRLAVGSLKTIPAAAIARLMGDFLRAHPEVVLDLTESSAEVLAARLDKGTLDIAVTALSADRASGPSHSLYREDFVVAAPAGHPLARRSRTAIADLQGAPFVFRPYCERQLEAERVFDTHGIRPRIAYRAADDERALAMVAAGLGCCFMPECYRDPGVTPLAVPELAFHRTVGLAWREAAPEPAMQFRDFAASHDWRGDGRFDIAH